MNEKEIDMNELIESFGECSTDYTKTACTYYANYLEEYQKEKIKLEHNWNELKKWLEEEIYKIEPKGTAINYNCEYDSEEDYINAMKERSKLITLKRVLIMLQSLEEGGNNENN